jgi:hypothetical protein
MNKTYEDTNMNTGLSNLNQMNDAMHYNVSKRNYESPT